MKKIWTLLFTTVILSITMMVLLSTNVSAAIRDFGPYTITYHLDGGTNAVKNPDVYTLEDTITLKDASKEGYDFAGWFLDSDKTERVTQISGSGNVDVYAKFTPISYTATFNDNGATKSSELIITLDDARGTKKTFSVNYTAPKAMDTK